MNRFNLIFLALCCLLLALLQQCIPPSPPLRAEEAAAQTTAITYTDTAGTTLFWTESRPEEGGRQVLIKQEEGKPPLEITPQPYSVASRVHEYGGKAFAVSKEVFYFINKSDQNLYKIDPSGKISPVITESYRFVQPLITPEGIIAVTEEHLASGEVINFLALITLEGKTLRLAEGADFYSSPAFFEKEKKLAWISWNHPQMPWDGTVLTVATLDKGKLYNIEDIAGGSSEAIIEPQWLADGTLLFASDKSGFWNLYSYSNQEKKSVAPMCADFGQALSRMGQSSRCETEEGLLVTYCQKGIGYLGLISKNQNTLKLLDLPFTYFDQLRSAGSCAYFLAGSPTAPLALYKIDMKTLQWECVAGKQKADLKLSQISQPESLEFPSKKGRIAYGFYYPPTVKGNNPPPLLVKAHGGPTKHAPSVFNPLIQFWTSRGFGVIDVNYCGSTGFGKKYRDALKGQWGIVDVEDCVSAVEFLIAQGAADPKKIFISGGSAGGYTVLQALTSTSLFAAGASYYGISDLSLLKNETHKFESHYLDQLIPSEYYQERSPLYHIDRLSTPLIIFQGLKDQVVPPNQSERIAQALQQTKVPCEYIAYPNEGHGFQKKENLADSLEKEFQFYQKFL